MFFFHSDEVLGLRHVGDVSPGDIHVWPLLFFSREALRLVMRHVLGMYCGVEGRALELVHGPNGKPTLAPHQPFACRVSFNLTHSGQRALLAVTDGREVGVDLEQIRSGTNALALASRYFSRAEYELIRDQPAERRQQTFFRFWTAKEAVIKGLGTGLSTPLELFSVVFGADPATAHVESFDAARVDDDWVVRTLPCEEGWCAAVAARTSGWRVRLVGKLDGTVGASAECS